ncbi:MAG: hypothetical protein H8D23_29425 [Candidatus Brocadiales bacterium]|nr:hypothetical protein [Candidatus Brocadiales bacterium]
MNQSRINAISAELRKIEDWKKALLDELTRLQTGSRNTSNVQILEVTNQSKAADKIHLFRSLFKGRVDVYPRRFESQRTGRSGYQPACENEWISGISDKPRIILATGRFLGEAFDDSRLDTLFLTLPVSWKGVLVQYSGRLHRDHHGKQEAII